MTNHASADPKTDISLPTERPTAPVKNWRHLLEQSFIGQMYGEDTIKHQLF